MDWCELWLFVSEYHSNLLLVQIIKQGNASTLPFRIELAYAAIT